jgi:two-component system, cell cycle sensor histidine kinase and response regulator CckA
MKGNINASTSLHVLLLEDPGSLREELSRAGLDVILESAHTQDELRSHLGSTHVDILIFSVRSAVWDPFQTLEACLAARPEVPVICIAEEDEEDVALRLLSMGAIDYVLENRTARLPWAVKRACEEARRKKSYEETETELRQSQEFIKTVMDHLPIGIAVNSIDPTVDFEYMNDNFPKFYRTTRESLSGADAFWAAVYEDEELRKDMRAKVLKSMASGDHREMRWEEVPLTRKSEETRFVTAVNIPVTGRGFVVSTVWDVTESKRVKDALEDEATRRRILVEQSQDGIVILQQDGRVFEANRRFAEMIGYSPEETKGLSVWDWEAISKKDDVLEMLRIVDDTGARLETRHRRKDGTLFDVDISTNGAVIGGQKLIFCVCRDITARNQAAAERERLLAAIGQTGETVVITDPDGTIRYVNPAFERVTGYIREDALGQNPRILKSGEHNRTFYDTMWSTISSGRIWEGRIVNKRKDGKLYTEAATISPVRDSAGQVINYVAVKRDITEQIRLTDQLQQAQRMESVGRLAGGVAHDFNNILSVILGYTELAVKKTDPVSPIYGDLQEVRKAANRSADITRQLLAFARKQTIAPRTLDLNETIEGMLKMLRRLIGEDITLTWKPRAKLWPVKMDPSQIDQLLANLCVNARDAISNVGRIMIETDHVSFDENYVGDHPGSSQGEFVLLAVSDDGCGMGKETQSKIFEPFFTTKGPGEGTGLGLATVYGIVKQNDGFINVYSEPGKGTTFRIYLPRQAGKMETSREKKETAAERGRGETILIVEDDLPILRLTERFLNGLGYKVIAANSPEEAVKISDRFAGEIRLLITDVVMPGMNGKELAEQLRRVRPDIKCLFMSGYTANAIAHRGVLDENIRFVQKPFSLVDLAASVRGAVDQED